MVAGYIIIKLLSIRSDKTAPFHIQARLLRLHNTLIYFN